MCTLHLQVVKSIRVFSVVGYLAGPNIGQGYYYNSDKIADLNRPNTANMPHLNVATLGRPLCITNISLQWPKLTINSCVSPMPSVYFDKQTSEKYYVTFASM